MLTVRNEPPLKSSPAKPLDVLGRALLFQSTFTIDFFYKVLEPLELKTSDLAILAICLLYKNKNGCISLTILKRYLRYTWTRRPPKEKLLSRLIEGEYISVVGNFVRIEPKGVKIVLMWDEYVAHTLWEKRNLFINRQVAE